LGGDTFVKHLAQQLFPIGDPQVNLHEWYSLCINTKARSRNLLEIGPLDIFEFFFLAFTELFAKVEHDPVVGIGFDQSPVDLLRIGC